MDEMNSEYVPFSSRELCALLFTKHRKVIFYHLYWKWCDFKNACVWWVSVLHAWVWDKIYTMYYALTHFKERKEMRELADSLTGRPVTNKDTKYLLKCAASRERWTPEELQEMLGTETKKGNGAG